MAVESGDRFGNWVVLDTSSAERANDYKVLCRCDCGIVRATQSKYLRRGLSRSCGCDGIYVGRMIDRGEILTIRHFRGPRYLTIKCLDCSLTFESRYAHGSTRGGCPNCRPIWQQHGESGQQQTKEYRAWKSMHYRCGPSGHEEYLDRGIAICERWNRYEAFLADMGRAPEGHRISIDRIDNDGNYEPTNCRWTTPLVQANNRRGTRRYELCKRRPDLVLAMSVIA